VALGSERLDSFAVEGDIAIVSIDAGEGQWAVEEVGLPGR
jgi:hypothetical protein